ncbi:hypothetical protein AAY473_032146 [Plecturocebus cupreus]
MRTRKEPSAAPRPRPAAPRTAPAAHLRQVLLGEKIRLAALEAVLTLALLEDVGPEFPARLLLGCRHRRRRGSSSQAGAELPAGLGLTAATAASLADAAAGPARRPPRRLAARAEAPAPPGSHSAHNSPRASAQPRPAAASHGRGLGPLPSAAARLSGAVRRRPGSPPPQPKPWTPTSRCDQQRSTSRTAPGAAR